MTATSGQTAYLGFGTWLKVETAVAPMRDPVTLSVYVADAIGSAVGDYRHSGDLVMSLAEAVTFLAAIDGKEAPGSVRDGEGSRP